MTTPPGKPEPVDLFGLPKIDLGDGKDASSDRDFSRAPITSGGTITGQAFQTSGVDPRITLDSTSLICHNAAGSTTFKIDISTGVVSLLTGAGVNAVLQWVDAAGVVRARIIYENLIGGNAIVLESIDNTTIGAVTVLGALTTAYSVVDLRTGGAGSAGITAASASATVVAGVSAIHLTGGVRADLVLFGGIANVNYISVADTTSRLRIGSGATAATGPVDVINGQVVLSNGGTENDIICALAAFTASVGVRYTAAAAAAIGGTFNMYRQVRGNSAGARVVPAGGVYTPTTATNVAAASVSAFSAVAALFNVSSTAAGNVVALGGVVFS